MQPSLDVSIIVVNWNAVSYLRKCLASVRDGTDGVSFETIVVDNDGAAAAESGLWREFPEARLIRADRNLGFARANNLGFRQSRGRNILFLNPDTEARSGAIRTMLANLERTSDAGAIGCKLLNSDLTVQTSCVQRFPTIANQVFGAEWLRRRLPLLRCWGIGPLFDSFGDPTPVDIVSGACLMVRREAFERVGLFNEEYFMYAEDMDLCYRIRQAGMRVYYTGEATVVHHGGGSSRDPKSHRVASVRQKEAMRRFCAATRGNLYGAAYRIAIGVSALARIAALAAARGLRRADPRPAAALAKWTAILRWAAGLESV